MGHAVRRIAAVAHTESQPRQQRCVETLAVPEEKPRGAMSEAQVQSHELTVASNIYELYRCKASAKP